MHELKTMQDSNYKGYISIPSQNVKQNKSGSNVAKHLWDNDHIVDFDNAKIIDKGKFRCRLTSESWHTAKDKNADNNSKPCTSATVYSPN